MSPHVDILEQQERLGRPFIGSILFHTGLAVVIAGATWVSHQDGLKLGTSDGGRMGIVIVNPVNIPLPNRGAQVNPVANDTKSQVPTPPPEKKAPPKATQKPPDTNAVPLPSKNSTKKPSWWIADQPNNKFREKQKFDTGQLYSKAGQALSNPNMQIQGGGGVGLSGSNSPFGSQFGAYADLLISQVARKWNKPGVDARNATPHVTVSFTLHRDGTVSDVKITQRSGNQALDYSGQRAIFDAAPFPPFPAGLNKSAVGIDFVFELGR